MAIITFTGALAVLFLATCNRVPCLETVADRLERRVTQEQASQLELTRQLNEVSSPPALQDFAPKYGLTEQEPPQDVVTITSLTPATPAAPQATKPAPAPPASRLAQVGHPTPQ
jgi:hypothetical protein